MILVSKALGDNFSKTKIIELSAKRINTINSKIYDGFNKLDDAIKELEKQSSELVEFNKVYSEIGNLKAEISENLKL